MPGGYVPPHLKRREACKTSNAPAPSSSRSSSSHAPSTAHAATLEEFVQTIARAEKVLSKSKRAEALILYEEAVNGLRKLVITHAGDEARSALADALLQFARETVLTARALPLSETSRGDSRTATERALALCEEAFTLYGHNTEDQLERASGMATSLSSIAEYAGDARGFAFSRDFSFKAVKEFDTVVKLLESKPHAQADMLPALWNAADARLKFAENAIELGDDKNAKVCFEEMLQLYERACGYADASQGDDLGGLLYDWGCSVTSFAQFMLNLGAYEDAIRTINIAIEKLTTARSFSVGALEPLNAIGDAYQTKAEICRARGDDNEAAECFYAAMSEGFDSALKTNALNLDAQIGVGEACMELGRLSFGQRDYAGAQRLFERAWSSYQKAIANTTGDPGSCEERFSVVYNAACAAKRAGFDDDAERLVSMLIVCNGTTREAIDNDVDWQ